MMDLTPLEVRKKKGDFRRQIRGYDPESVDDFLDLVADRLEVLVRENVALAESSGALEQRVSEYREREKALTEALVSAQQLREQMRATAVREAEAARSQAEKDAHEHRSLAAQEAEQSRREARALLEQARAEAAHQIDAARTSATAEMERIRSEIERIRVRETEAIRLLQLRRAELLDGYGAMLAQQMAGLESLRASVAGDGDPLEGLVPEAVSQGPAVEAVCAEPAADELAADGDALPPLSADLAALIAAAESEVEQTWPVDHEASEAEPTVSETAAEARDPVAESPQGGDASTADAVDAVDAALDALDALEDSADADELLLDEVEMQADAGAQSPAASKVEQPAPVLGAWEMEAESDEDFIDSLIAEAGMPPAQTGSPSVPVPGFPKDREPQDAEPVADAGVMELVEDEGTAAPELLVLEEDELFQAEDFATAADVEETEVAGADEAVALLDEDEGFDALFDEGDEDPADFDFDAALASATGFSGYPGDASDAEGAFDLGIELDASGSGRDVGRAGAFGPHDVPAVRNTFSTARPSDLTLRPLSPEEEAPELPVESRQTDETDDDMFSTMFHGR